MPDVWQLSAAGDSIHLPHGMSERDEKRTLWWYNAIKKLLYRRNDATKMKVCLTGKIKYQK